MSLAFVFLKAFGAIIDTQFDKVIFLGLLSFDINNVFTILRWWRVRGR